jgi:hypothetical protein
MTANAGEGAKELIRRTVELGIAKSRDEAVDLLEEYGRAEVERRIKEEEEVQKLVEKWLKEGFPYEGLDTSDLREERNG